MLEELMNSMILSCVKATGLIEKKQKVSIGIVKNMQLQMHIALCSGCRNYLRQSIIIEKTLQKKFNDATGNENADELKAAIARRISSS